MRVRPMDMNESDGARREGDSVPSRIVFCVGCVGCCVSCVCFSFPVLLLSVICIGPRVPRTPECAKARLHSILNVFR
jgi:hypothetical protein